MATHIISRRIQYIIQYVNDFKHPSKKKILDFLNEKDFSVSSRTLERDIERIRADFGMEIIYNKESNGYYINEEKSFKVDSFFRFLEIVTLADILTKSLKNGNKTLQYVSFDDSTHFKGIENLKDILIAINQKRELHFTHENFSMHRFKEYVITPLLLKEYGNRWYIIGVPIGMEEIRTFGIDRISELTLGKLSNVKQKHFETQIKGFKNIIGLNYQNKKPVKIRLLVEGLHIKYMQSLPLHHSQIIHSKNEKGQSFVDFFLIPNYEFITQILKITNETEVIYPEKLKLEIKRILKKSLDKYN